MLLILSGLQLMLLSTSSLLWAESLLWIPLLLEEVVLFTILLEPSIPFVPF